MGKGNSFKAIINEQAAWVNSEGKNLSDCRSNRRLLIAMNRKDGLSYLLSLIGFSSGYPLQFCHKARHRSSAKFSLLSRSPSTK